MRIYDAEGNRLSEVFLALEDAEASELRDALEQLMAEGQGFHAHVADSAYQVEVTMFRADDHTVSARFAEHS